ncbi:hypothetical protein MKW92_023934 [Papaver armeniacum]|nr:hypothetical protein MKW92_023934 [Papaver armeniacum]
MAFWGVKLEPGKPYTHGYNSSLGRLCISRATFGDFNSSKEHVFVQCEVGKRSPISLCLLDANNASCTLDIEFEEKEENVVFEVIGSRSVRLTGFYLGHNGQSGTGDFITRKAGNEVSGSASQVAEVKNEVNVLEMGRDSGYKETVVNGRHVRTMASGLVCIRYFAQIKSTGYVFESNYSTTLISYCYRLGKGDLIKGLEDGINGMHVGDRRRLTVPPSLGYALVTQPYCGSKAWSDVPTDAWLVCEVNLESVRDVPPETVQRVIHFKL